MWYYGEAFMRFAGDILLEFRLRYSYRQRNAVQFVPPDGLSRSEMRTFPTVTRVILFVQITCVASFLALVFRHLRH